MARNLIMGYYYCNLSHAHSSDTEVAQCNKIEEEKHKREQCLVKDCLENKRIEQENEAQRIKLEQKKIDLERETLQHEMKKMNHREKMAAFEIEKMRIENEKYI